MTQKKLKFYRHFTQNFSKRPYDEISWRKLDVTVHVGDGTTMVVKDVEVPSTWSDRAATIVADKYFRVIDGKRETSVRQIVYRVSATITEAGKRQGLFDTLEDAITFEDELAYMLLTQRFSFNSPVWFNIGVPGSRQQASACFIQSVKDDMDALGTLQKKESRLFKYGSGTGSNFSPLRSSYEQLSNGGVASGPVSFMEGFDAWAKVVKSGGGTRRAAKMVMLDVDHPDILQQKNGLPGFIRCKSHAEKVAHLLIDAGYPGEFHIPGNAYEIVGFQNANNSVRVSDEFMQAVVEDGDWHTREVLTGKVVHTYKAKQLFREMAEAAHFCGDPGIQYDTTINKWHTCANTDCINGSNPCSEYMFLDDTACNLASHNLLHYLIDGHFAVADFIYANRVGITAMEILVGYAEYPSEEIHANSLKFRPLGIGYANLGALLMCMGYAYDSSEGRAIAGAITSLMSSTCYVQSSAMARAIGAFDGYKENYDCMLKVIRMHRDAHGGISIPEEFAYLLEHGENQWDTALINGKTYGYRNSQISVLAPTGTIGFMMDCDTTGVEPMTFLVAVKKLVGGTTMKIASRVVGQALYNLNYSEETIAEIERKIDETGDFPFELIKDSHKTIFQTATGDGDAGISVMGHLKMMSAVQPFLSGAISKTVNMPEQATVEDVEEAYMKGWTLGLKAVAIYRNGCKRSQPLTKKKKVEDIVKELDTVTSKKPDLSVAQKIDFKWGHRKRLAVTRQSLTHKFSVGGQDGYITVGLYPDGSPGEIFINVSKAGSTLHGFTDMWATAMSIGLQHGVPLNTYVDKFLGMKFEPAGFTSNPDIRMTSSIGDYIARFLEKTFVETVDKNEGYKEAPLSLKINEVDVKGAIQSVSYDGPPCLKCGTVTRRSGACHVCPECAETTGCS